MEKVPKYPSKGSSIVALTGFMKQLIILDNLMIFLIWHWQLKLRSCQSVCKVIRLQLSYKRTNFI